MTLEEKDKKFTELLTNGIDRDEITEIAQSWAHEHANGLEEETAMFLGFMAGYENGWGIGLQEAVDIYCED